MPCVLIVDDDEDLARVLADAISPLGCRTAWARHGREGLLALKRERPVLMLVDIFMPVMSGPEFLRLVRTSADWSTIPRVIMTGANDPMLGVREDAALLFKPIDLDTFVPLVRRYCAAPRRTDREQVAGRD
jgi:CheY-like chemotaxis protein